MSVSVAAINSSVCLFGGLFLYFVLYVSLLLFFVCSLICSCFLVFLLVFLFVLFCFVVVRASLFVMLPLLSFGLVWFGLAC